MNVFNEQPTHYTFQRYLAAKRTVDDRALNQHVWNTLHTEMARRASPNQPFTILEIGGGIGTMIERLLDEQRLPSHTSYHLLDEQADNIAEAASRLTQRFTEIQNDQPTPGSFAIAPTTTLRVQDPNLGLLDVHLYTGDLFDFLNTAGSLATVDLIIAHAFMDLVDIPATLPLLTATLRPNTLLYFTINFDGATILEPTIDPAYDAHIEHVYHRTMDERITNGKRSGDSHTGRHLFHNMKTANIHTLDAGSSDWVIFPHGVADQSGKNQGGTYPHDEAYFLHFIVHTMHGALRDHPDIRSPRFEKWIATRHAQIERGELVYIAHQLDYLAVTGA